MSHCRLVLPYLISLDMRLSSSEKAPIRSRRLTKRQIPNTKTCFFHINSDSDLNKNNTKKNKRHDLYLNILAGS